MSKKIILSDEIIINIKNLYASGMTIKKIAERYNLEKRNISKALNGITKSGRFIGLSINEIFIENSPYNRSNLRLRVIKENLIDYKCNFCGLSGYWNNKELKLQIDHINGIGTDHRLENLRFLCPNCHSQTDTFGAKNYKTNKKNILLRIPINDLKMIIKSSKSLSEILIKCNLPIRSHLFNSLKEISETENIDILHIFDRFKTQRNGKYKIAPNELFVEHCKHHNTSVKHRVIKENLLTNKCSLCDLPPIWNNKELVLQLDHINGINNDNRLVNLRLLCYNCHSQTQTFMLGANRLALKK